MTDLFPRVFRGAKGMSQLWPAHHAGGFQGKTHDEQTGSISGIGSIHHFQIEINSDCFLKYGRTRPIRLTRSDFSESGRRRLDAG
jgi:hypothetical protein